MCQPRKHLARIFFSGLLYVRECFLDNSFVQECFFLGKCTCRIYIFFKSPTPPPSEVKWLVPSIVYKSLCMQRINMLNIASDTQTNDHIAW